jgi:drug/metabolite transporter (DMT)-like permease
MQASYRLIPKIYDIITQILHQDRLARRVIITNHKSTSLHSILVLLGACSFGILSTLVVFAYDEGFKVGEVVGSQMLFGFVCMWILVIGMRLPLRTQSTASMSPRKVLKYWVQLLLVGSTMGLTGIFYYASLQTIPASIAVVLLFQFTWIGVLIEAVLERKMPDRLTRLALIPIGIGTLLAGGVLQEQSFEYTWSGIVLGLCASISYAFFILYSGRAALEMHPVVRSSVMASGGFLIAIIVFPPVFLWNGSLWNGLWLWGLLLALLGIVIPTVLFTIGVPKVGGGWASILSAAELPTAVVLSSFVLREYVSGWQWTGVIVILAAITIPEWIRERRRRIAQTPG